MCPQLLTACSAILIDYPKFSTPSIKISLAISVCCLKIGGMKHTRPDKRKPNQLRPVRITRGYTRYAPGSVLIEMGNTKVLCTAFIEQKVPAWKTDSGSGWLTAEYSMLPSSTPDRKRRNIGKIDGRSQEIQRIIGRSLRAAVDFDKLGENTITIDCDVLQADGGTRTAAITGGYVALIDAINFAQKEKIISANPIKGSVAAVSAGIVNSRILLDLNYEEDAQAEVDFNIVMTNKLEFIEVQGTAENGTFTQSQLDGILKSGKSGIRKLLKFQNEAMNRKK